MIREIDVEEMETLLDDGAQLVDVREEDELEDGVIDGSVHMPLSDFESCRGQLSKTSAIIFYCSGGRRSLKTAEMAERWGLSELYSLRGGFKAYAEREDY